MGMFDELYFDCPQCGLPCYLQLKICEFPMMAQWRVGSHVYLDEVYPEYQRHIIDNKWDRCGKCGSAFVFDCTSGQIRMEVWDEKETLSNPTQDYFEGMNFYLHYYTDPSALHVFWLSQIVGDPEIFWFSPPPPDVET